MGMVRDVMFAVRRSSVAAHTMPDVQRVGPKALRHFAARIRFGASERSWDLTIICMVQRVRRLKPKAHLASLLRRHKPSGTPRRALR